MADNATLRGIIRRLWESACKDAPERPSCKVVNGNFMLTIGNKQNWENLVHLNGVPGHAEQVIEGDMLRCTWPSIADAIFGEDGMMADRYEGYEVRRPQLQMARLVQRAIEMDDIAVIEAGTGTGKSFAYAAVCMAMGLKVVISTSNKALQSQLYTKDIPFLQELFPGQTVALAQGKGNYACKSKLDEDGELFAEPVEDKQFLDWFWWTDTGNLEEIDFPLGRDLYGAVAADEDCMGSKCALYDWCFYYQAYRERMDADVVICNHALLAQHLKTGNLLPEWDVLVVDEAHNIVEDIRNAVGTEVNVGALFKHINLAKPYVAPETIQFAEALIDPFRKEVVGEGTLSSPEIKVHEHTEYPSGQKLRAGLLDLADLVQEADVVDDRLKKKRGKRVERISGAAERLGTFLTHDSGSVRWAEQRGDKLYLHSKPLYVGDVIADMASWAPTIFCSATLATPDLLPYLETIGVEDALQMVVTSPFDYASNALLYVPRGTDPDPKDEKIGQYLNERLLSLVGASRGGALLLFTSRRQMDAMYASTAYTMRKGLKLTVLHQDGKTTRQELIRQFKADGNAVLFATRSFFEGVDIGGDALRLVVLDKLPFEAPTELSKAIEGLLGMRAFQDKQFPDMLIILKQAVGRLIRTSSDRGVIAILDSRIRARWRSRVFGSLPPAPDTYDIADVVDFFALPYNEPVAVQESLFA